LYIFASKEAEMRTLQITGNSLEANKFIEFARTLPFVREQYSEDEDIRPMTLKEYNAMLDEAEEDYRNGRFVSHEEMGRRIASWR
jgi:hypothetical protein